LGNKTQTVKVFVLILLMSAVGFIGYNTLMRDGLEFRFPMEILAISSGSTKQLSNLHNQEWRQYRCFLEESQTFADFQKCPTSNDPNKPTLVLWGDSHAASLYPGYAALYSDRYNVTQRTTALCPPILGFVKYDRPNCKKINDDLYEWIVSTKPNKVVLAAWWTDYDWEEIEATIVKLKQAGVVNIDLVGPLPQWSEHLPNIVMKAFKSDPLHRIPDYLNRGLKPQFLELDAKMRKIAQRQGVHYFSPAQYLCKPQGCLAVFNDPNAPNPSAQLSYTAFDLAHLTSPASRYLVAQFPQD